MPFSRLITGLRADLHPDTERGKLVRSAGTTMAIKVAAMLVAFVSSVLYARVLGPHGFGLYSYVIAWVSILAIPAGLGMQQYLVREGAKHPEAIGSLRRWADQRVILAGALVAGLLACAALVPAAAGARWLFVIAAPLPLLMNLAMVRQSLLQARGWIARSQWPQLLLAPTVMLAGLLGLWLARGTFGPMEVIVATVAVALLPVLLNSAQLGKAAPQTKPGPADNPRIRQALPFMWLGGMYLLISRTDLIMLGSLRGAEEAGIYAVASRAAELLPFISYAATTVAAPMFARLHKDGQTQQLQRLLSGMGRRVLMATAPMAVAMIVFAEPLLRLLYGSAYTDGVRVLQILGISQLVIVLGGPMGTLLNMSGHERTHLWAIGAGLLANVALNSVLIPLFGSLGAASATCASVALARLLLLVLVRRHLGFRPTAIDI